MKRLALALTALLVCTAALAMLTGHDIEKVTPVIGELTRNDFAAVKSGKMTRAQLAEALLGYLAEAESEAAKLVLVRETQTSGGFTI